MKQPRVADRKFRRRELQLGAILYMYRYVFAYFSVDFFFVKENGDSDGVPLTLLPFSNPEIQDERYSC